MSGRRARKERRLKVGWYVETLAPLTAVSVQMQLGRLLGADAFWFGDHVAHAIPDALWDPKMTPMARFIPSLDAWFDPTVLIARYGRRWRRPMGVSVTDPFRRSAADLARAWLSLHHTSGGRVVLGIGAGERIESRPPGGVLHPSGGPPRGHTECHPRRLVVGWRAGDAQWAVSPMGERCLPAAVSRIHAADLGGRRRAEGVRGRRPVGRRLDQLHAPAQTVAGGRQPRGGRGGSRRPGSDRH